MSEIANQNLSGVSETLLLPLYIRAMESQRPDALIKDDQAVALIEKLNPEKRGMGSEGKDTGKS